jgi:hypothetical protein
MEARSVSPSKVASTTNDEASERLEEVGPEEAARAAALFT